MPKILIADDNSNIQKMVALAFEDHKIEVVAVGNGEAAVKKLPDLKPDLILADVFMPVRNGYEVCEFVKRDARYSSIPVILLVGAFDPLDETEAKRVGADGVLKKPFVPPDPLISLVTELLNKHAKSVAKSAASKAAKEKEVAAETLPSLMPRRSQEPLPNSSGADDDVYIVGKGREAINDLNPQTAISSRQGAGSSNAYSNSNFTPQAVPAGNIPSDHSDSFNETNADARRRTEVDYQSVPSFSSALIGDSAAESGSELADDQGSAHKTVIQRLQERQEEEERRTVVPSPHAGAEPHQESQPPETNWAALVKSFTAAPFSISEPPPVAEQRQVEAASATTQSVSSQVAVESAQAPFDHSAASSSAKNSAAPSVAETGQSIYEAGYQAASAASQPVSDANSSSAFSLAGQTGASASTTEEVFTAPLRDESSSRHDHSSHAENSTHAESASGNELPASLEGNKPAFDEGLWSKIAMHATMPSEPPAPPKDLNSSDTAAQMIAAASEAAAAFSRGGFSLPGQSATPQSEAAQSDKSNSASASAQRLDAGKPNQQERSFFSFSPSDGLNTEAAPTPRDVPHVFPSGAPDQNKDQTEDQTSPESAAPSNDSIGIAAHNAADAKSSANTTASANVDEIVARVIERLAPQLQELISKGVLRPLVEDILRDPQAPKKN